MNPDPSSALHRLIAEQMGDALIYADREGVIREWNAGAEALFGYPKAEAVGRSLDLIIPERLRAAHWAGFDRAMQNGATKHGRRALLTRSMNHAGETIYVEMTFAVVADAGRVLGSVAIARDGTRRREDERRLRECEAALDVGRAPEQSAPSKD
ncbi:MAG: PAS domain S-box protein [Aromatoleum sp.]|jgi:PAS domain S-box-containing protein|uniref:PAS domain S-box protein n=1 Tax=Aromatoleum sp. TaxID=2307007 RepID=UPI002893B5EB|nr:PAS domain S-box protein [Aromatoleum sp.]MDT3670110.1 PAS domain S-box protein [Aromatoleum sp.]